MIIRAQNSFSFVNFDHVKIIQINPFDEKFRIEAKLEKADDIFGTYLAGYKDRKQAMCEMQRLYQAYEDGEKTFMFKSDETEPETETENDGSGKTV